MNSKVLIAGCALGVGVLAVQSCKKEPEEEVRQKVREAGYEMSQGAFFRAAESDDIVAMRGMVSGGMSVFEMDGVGRSALHAAAGSGAMKAVDYLLSEGIVIDARDEHERTPLMEAVIRSTPEMVRYLLQQGADPQAKDADQFKPLMLAVRENRKEIVSVLAPYVREDLDDALLAAAILGQAEVIDELTNYGASVYSRFEDGRTPLMLAAQKGQMEAVEMLLSIGANRLAMDEEGRTASDYAKLEGHEEVAARLEGGPMAEDFDLTDTAELSAELMQTVAASDEVEPESGRITQQEDGSEGPVSSSPSLPVELEGATVGALAVRDEPSESAESESVVPGVASSGDSGDTPTMPTDEIPAVAETAGNSAKARVDYFPVVMRSYRQRELPLRVKSVEDDRAEIQVVGGSLHQLAVGDEVPGTRLLVVKVERRMQSGKERGGEPMEVSVVEIEDASNGIRRDLIVGVPALSHEPMALVEDASSGRYYVARRGQRFSTEDGVDFLVDDVRPNQLVLENLNTGEMKTVRLVGPQG